MPVIECACGMVMSVPRDGPRASCIRCGAVVFRPVLRHTGERPKRGTVFPTPRAHPAVPNLILSGTASNDGGAVEPFCFSI
jgi:hypothetical protein